jgi:hypothetical protein
LQAPSFPERHFAGSVSLFFGSLRIYKQLVQERKIDKLNNIIEMVY